MATEKRYLDAEGLTILVKYINHRLNSLDMAIDETPESIQLAVDNAINQLKIEDLEQSDDLIIYGGTAPEEGAE